MTHAPSPSRRLALLIGTAAVLLAPGSRAQTRATPAPPARPAAAPVNPVARLFVVGPSSPRAELEEAARRRRVDCRASKPVQVGTPPRPALPVVCAVALIAPVPASATYWYEDDALARAFLVDAGYGRDIDEYVQRFQVLEHWISGALGAPTRPLELPPGWGGARPLPPAMRMEQLMLGRARLSLVWERPDATVELWLAGERGQPRLAVGVRRQGAPPPRCTPDAITEALLDLFPPTPADARARSAALLAACKVTRAAGALDAALAHDDEPVVRAQAIRSLAELGHAPPADELERLARKGAPPVVAAAREALARPSTVAAPAPPAPPIARPALPATAAAPEASPAPEAPLYGPPTPSAPIAIKEETPPESPLHPAALRAPPLQSAEPTPMVVATPKPPPEEKPSGPVSGVPLVIGASTVAGATLMRNISIWGGLTSATPQLLLGSAGAVIGFGTSWGLSRFGLRPTVEQAAWYANTTAWGTLAGVAAWGVSGSTSDTAKYGWPVVGQALGMGAGVWSASKWSWTLPQIGLADSFVLGAGLSSMGFDLLRDDTPKLTLKDTIGMPIVMVGSAVATRYLDPTPRDMGLMTTTALAGGWTGGMLASGIVGTDWLGSRQSWGGVAAGLGLGYLGGAAASAFVETPPERLGVAAGGMLAGNALGLGLHLAAQGFSHSNEPGATFTEDEVHARSVGAAVGGLVLGGVGYAYEPHLHPGPRAVPMTITGALYGAGAWWLASAASYHGQPIGPVDDARLEGGLLTGASLGALTGLVSSRWFAPDPEEQVVAAGTTFLGMGAGLGVAKLVTDTKGTPDAVGVLAGATVGLGGGIVTTRSLRLRAPDVGAGLVGALEGLLVGRLAPTLDQPSWDDSRATAGGTLLGMSVGAAGGVAAAHLTHATGGEVGVATTAGGLGLLAGLGAGYMLPCETFQPCTSRAPRIGAVAGSLGLMGAAMALEPQLHLSTTLGPDATTLASLGAAFGAADGLMLAGALDDGGTISGTPARQGWGGVLAGASTEAAAGLVASKYVRLRSGDGLFLASGKLTGGLFGLGAALLARDQTGAADTLATLTGSVAGVAAAGVVQAYTPLDSTDSGAAITGAAFGGFLGSLVPTLDEPWWDGIGHRKTGGGFLVGLSAGAVAGAAASHATDAQPRDVGFTILGGVDGLLTGLGAGLLFADESDPLRNPNPSTRPERIGMLVGTPVGLAVGALAWPRLRFDAGDRPFVAASTGLGAWMGFWLPALGHADANAISAQKRWGGVLGGAGLASIGTSLLTPALELDTDLVTDALALDAVWSAAGAGAGALASTRDDAPVWGMLGAGTAGLVLGGALHRQIEIGGAETPFLTLAAAEGTWLGGWIPALTENPTSRQRAGALALGGFGGLGLSTLLSPVVKPSADLVVNAAAVDALWTGAGAGAGLLFSTGDKAPVWSMLGAGVAGLTVGGAMHDAIDIGADDAPLLALAGGEGAWLGAWAPSLLDSPTARQHTGALMLGGFGALGAATVLSPVLKPSADLAVNAAAVDALWTGAGAGAGLLFATGDKAPVWSMLGAGVAGLTVGGAMHDAIDIGADDAPLMALAGGEGVWLGAWVPSLFDKPSDRQRAGALMLGGFGAMGAATVLSPVLHLDADVAENAAGVGGLWTGAGAGAGLLFARSDKAPVWGHLTAGAAGLVLGGALHRSIEIDAGDAPLLTLAGGEGVWLGGWFPYLLHDREDVTGRERAGAAMLGGFGSLGLATLASGGLELSSGRAGYGGMGSAIGASVGGGIALLAPSLGDRGGVGLMLGGTTVGLAVGMGVAPLLTSAPTDRLVGGAAAGAALGASESLLFAWSGRASDSHQYAGAALVGGGVGATLGLATAAAPPDDHSTAPAAAGFAAWGAWMGSFTGSLVQNDTHDIVMGGLLGANAGFLAGYGLLKSELVEPRDFGWLSLFGAIGTVVGAGAGAGASHGNPTAIRAGLAIGPAAGMISGAIVLPRLRRALTPSSPPAGKTASARRTRRLAASETERGDVSDDAPSATAGDDVEESLLGRKLAQVGAVTDWAPMVGALPAPAETGPAPVLFGVTGHWK